MARRRPRARPSGRCLRARLARCAVIAAAGVFAAGAVLAPRASAAAADPEPTVGPTNVGPTKVGPLRVCFLEDDAPRAHRSSGRGFDLAVLHAVAADAGVAMEPVWTPSRSGFSEIEATDLPLGRLVREECDAAASVPGEASLGRQRDRLALSRPYYGAAFELIAAGDAPAALGALAGRRVGVQLQSFAHLAAQALALDWRARPTPREVLELYDAGEVEAALVWGPALATLGRAPHPGWTPPRALRWNEHVAVRRGSPWLAVVDRALARLEADGTLERLARENAIPVRPPFASTSDASALAELRAGNTVAER